MFDFTTLTDSQREAVVRSDEPAFIMAGAGTGKTYTLSKRIAYQMSAAEENLEPEKLMAITFTEAAAAELLDRARRQAMEAGAQDADRMESAWVSTIHSMCRRLLAENALDAGIDPGLVVLSEIQASQIMENVIEEAIADADEDRTRKSVEVLGGYSGLTSLIMSMQSCAARTPGGIAGMDFGPTDDSGLSKAQQLFLDALKGNERLYEITASKKKGSTAEKVYADLDAIRGAISWLENGGDFDLERFALTSTVKDVSSAKSDIMADFSTFKAAMAIETGLGLVPFIKELARDVEARMSERITSLDGLTFDALLARCHELLEDPKLALAYSERFDSVMVDEFQDTDAVQCDIVEKLCSDDRGIDKLIVVGDRQQSIYGFRGAEVSVSDDMQETMERRFEDAVVPLDVNFRSNPDILSFVGDVFSGDDFFGAGFLNLVPAEKNCLFELGGDKRPVIELLVTKTHTRTPQAKNALRTEAEAIAQRFEQIKAGDASVSYDDMALILRGFGHVDTYIDAFRSHGIPCAITGGRRFYSFAEVAAFTDVIEFLRSPDDDVVLLRVLVGSVFSVGDDEMASLKGIYNAACAEAGQNIALFDVCLGEDAPESVRLGAGILAKARRALSYKALSEVLGAVLEAARWSDSAALDPISASGRIANMNKMLDIVKELESTYGADWRAVADEVLANARSALEFNGKDNSQTPGRTVGSGKPGCVSIMTIHASKGLEYDIVAVSRVESSKNDSRRVLSAMVGGLGRRHMAVGLDLWKCAQDIRPGCGGLSPQDGYAGFLASLFARTVEDDDAEKKRLAYVALTRAKKKLIWTAGLTETKTGIGKSDKIFQMALETATGMPVSDIPYGITTTKSGCQVLYEGLDVPEQQPALPGSFAIPRFTVQAFPADEYDHDVQEDKNRKRASFTNDYADKALSSEARGLLGHASETAATHIPLADDAHGDATKFGSAFHSAARAMALRNAKLDESGIRSIAARWELSDKDDIDGLEKLAEVFFDARLKPVLEDTGMSVIPECPFAYVLGDKLVQGSIDLVESRGGAKRVVDYKTGLLGRDADYVIEHYGYQALVYAAAVLMMDDTESVQASFLLVEDGLREIILPTWDKAQLDEILATLENTWRSAEAAEYDV